MNGRERLSRVYNGEIADRIPWAPLIFDDTLSLYSDEIRKAGPMAFTKMIGGDVLWRMNACKVENDSLEMIVKEDATRIHKEYRTKMGSLFEVRQKTRYGEHRITKWPIETLGDVEIAAHIAEHQVVKPDYGPILSADEAIGDSGIVMIFQSTTPVQNLIQEWTGLTRFHLFLLRHRSDMESLMNIMHERNKEGYEVMAESPTEVQCIVENTDVNLVSPKIYEAYSLKHVKDFVDIMHAHGKRAFVHMCGKINALLPLIGRTGLDGIDSLTPSPTGDVDFKDIYRLLGDDFVIHGVLDPTTWQPDYRTELDIETNIDKLVEGISAKPFILCTAADGLPGFPIEKFKAIGRIMQKYVF
jgi:hypothetical protein